MDKAPEVEAKASVYADIDLNDAQQKAIEIAQRLTKDVLLGKTSVGILTGYAGTGKTTIIRHIAKLLKHIIVLAPTGKAALRVTEATGVEAKTIHRWLYVAGEDEKGNPVFTHKFDIDQHVERPASGLIVIDEASMVDEKLWKDIYEAARILKCSVLCVGDTFQLPPVSDSEKPFSLLDPPFEVGYKIHLTEIMRQALDNPIIRASMYVRDGNIDGALKCVPLINSFEEFVWAADFVTRAGGVVICHKNTTRHRLNGEMRKVRNLKESIEEGEPLLILRNNYDLDVFNGEVRAFEGWRRITKEPCTVKDKWRKVEAQTRFGLANVEGRKVYLAESGVYGNLDHVSYQALKWRARVAGKEMDIFDVDAFQFVLANFGYALTCHKAQGSEWKDVVVHLEPSVLRASDGPRWLYTALTRAKERLAVYTGR